MFDLTSLDIIARLVIGLVIGFCIGLTGVGGGVLMIPALTELLGFNTTQAVGTTSLYAFLTKIFTSKYDYVLVDLYLEQIETT